MKPKICIILTPDGIDSISVLSSGDHRMRKEGHRICSYIEDEITEFEKIVCNKLKEIGDDTAQRNAPKE